MAMKFAEASNYIEFVSKEKLEGLIRNVISMDKTQAIIFLYEDKGMLAATVGPFAYGDVLQATELAWWVEEEHRKSNIGKELLEAYAYWALKVGCKFMVMSCLDDSVGKYYEKNGFKLYERTYFKEL